MLCQFRFTLHYSANADKTIAGGLWTSVAGGLGSDVLVGNVGCCKRTGGGGDVGGDGDKDPADDGGGKFGYALFGASL